MSVMPCPDNLVLLKGLGGGLPSVNSIWSHTFCFRLAYLGLFPSGLSFLVVSVILAWISFPTLSALVVETLSLIPLPPITPFFGRMVFAVLVPMGFDSVFVTDG